MKKIWIISVIVAMLLILAACATNPAVPSGNEEIPSPSSSEEILETSNPQLTEVPNNNDDDDDDLHSMRFFEMKHDLHYIMGAIATTHYYLFMNADAFDLRTLSDLEWGETYITHNEWITRQYADGSYLETEAESFVGLQYIFNDNIEEILNAYGFNAISANNSSSAVNTFTFADNTSSAEFYLQFENLEDMKEKIREDGFPIYEYKGFAYGVRLRGLIKLSKTISEYYNELYYGEVAKNDIFDVNFYCPDETPIAYYVPIYLGRDDYVLYALFSDEFLFLDIVPNVYNDNSEEFFVYSFKDPSVEVLDPYGRIWARPSD